MSNPEQKIKIYKENLIMDITKSVKKCSICLLVLNIFVILFAAASCVLWICTFYLDESYVSPWVKCPDDWFTRNITYSVTPIL
jgi:hypothetical protein